MCFSFARLCLVLPLSPSLRRLGVRAWHRVPASCWTREVVANWLNRHAINLLTFPSSVPCLCCSVDPLFKAGDWASVRGIVFPPAGTPLRLEETARIAIARVQCKLHEGSLESVQEADSHISQVRATRMIMHRIPQNAVQAA